MKSYRKLAFARKNAQQGISLIELSIALAIIAVVTITGIIFATDSLKESRIAGEAARVNSIVMKSRAAFANAALANISAADPTTVSAAQLGVFPTDMLTVPVTSVNAATQVINRWGGNVRVRSEPTLSIMSLTYEDIPQSDCLEFVNRVSSLFSYINGGPTSSTTTNVIKTPTVPLSTTVLQTACAGNDNVITFGYSK